MTIPKNKLDGYRWLVEDCGLQLIKLQRERKEPVGYETGWAEIKDRRSFQDVKLNRNDNAGVLTGRISGIIVLDIDDSFLFPEEFEIPETFTVKTTKGFHHYYKLPDDGEVYRCREITSGFDIWADGGYVVAPWSRYSEMTYKILNDVEISNAPKWLLDLCKQESSSNAMVPATFSVTKPENFRHPQMNLSVLEEEVTKEKRSDQVRRVLHDLVDLKCSDEDIFYIFETYPKGIGEKYFEKGAGRVSWLKSQLEKVRKEYDDLYLEPVQAKDQAAVDELAQGIVTTIGSRKSVSSDQEESIRAFVNLLIAMYEGSTTGWYSIPIPVGGGKTQTLLHFIEWLYKNDKPTTFPVSVAFEKIEEIERASQWLRDRGVSNSFFQAVHHEVPDLLDVMKRLPDVPVILHTHQRLTGSSYIQDYFKYQGRIRKLLIYDESMLNALIHSEYTSDISTQLSKFLRAYEVNEDLPKKIPEDICRFFQAFNEEILKQEKSLMKGTGREIILEPDRSYLSGYGYGDLIRYSKIIENELGETDLYRTILLAAYAPSSLSRMSLVKDQGNAAVLVSKEILDSNIENLVTTDASREFRHLFKYTNRRDGKKVRIYKIRNFRWDEELIVNGIPLNSGRDSISKAFKEDPKGNDYLKEIAKVVREHRGHHEGGTNYLFFCPKGIAIIPPLVELKLIKEGLFDPKETDQVLHFETFGRETATDHYKDCDVIIFIGLNHKPKHTIKALLAGEGFTGDPDKVLKDVETGEFLQQLIVEMTKPTVNSDLR